jgi:hypothetical protein
MANKRSPKKRRPAPKTVLRLPDLDQAKSAVLNSLSSRDAQRGYPNPLNVKLLDGFQQRPASDFIDRGQPPLRFVEKAQRVSLNERFGNRSHVSSGGYTWRWA